jgi:SAM-dependent methyltransferase
LDYSTTQLAQAQERLGRADQYIYVAADVYRLPFRDCMFDASTMIRTLHHMADAPKALGQIRNVLRPGAVFILEFANKLNLKSILRYWLGRQGWNPFTLEPVEFVKLNFDFHPKAIKSWLGELGFSIEKTLAVSHFRLGLLKKIFPAGFLAALDGLFQPTGALWQFTPSVFVKAIVKESDATNDIPLRVIELFKCPECGNETLEEKQDHLHCSNCKAKWAVNDGVYDFRERMK